MTRALTRTLGVGLVAVSSMLFACIEDGEQPQQPQISQTTQEIIGGFPARSPFFNPVGALAFRLPPPPPPPPAGDGGVSDAGGPVDSGAIDDGDAGPPGATDATVPSDGGVPASDAGSLNASPVDRQQYLAARAARRPHLVDLIGADYQPQYQDTHVPFCSGTLVAPTVVLTAEHCAAVLFPGDEFVIGFNARIPEQTSVIAGVLAETTITGGFLGLGSDVAVLILEQPFSNVEPYAYAPLPDGSVGQPFAGIGYGVRNNNGESGLRYLGQMNLRGVGGNHALNSWGSFEEYERQFPNLRPELVEALVGGSPNPVQDLFALLELLPEYEATFGNAPGNAQACFGDSGGPILRWVNGKLTVFGVTSGGLGTIGQICDWGGVYSMLAPAALDVVDRGVACGLVPEEGQCTGTVLQRCAPPSEGGWEVVSTDCSLFGFDFICAADSAGEVGCMPDPCFGLPDGGICEGDTAVRCSLPNEGPRRRIETDCAILGTTCTTDNGTAECDLGGGVLSCEGNCGGSSQGPDGSICFCDAACRNLNDCCEDVEIFCPIDTSTNTATFGR